MSRIHPRSSLDEPNEEGEPDGHIAGDKKKKKILEPSKLENHRAAEAGAVHA